MGHRFSISLWARIKGFPAAKRLKRFAITVLAHYTTSFSRYLRLPLQCPHHVCLTVFLTPCLTVCLAPCHPAPVATVYLSSPLHKCILSFNPFVSVTHLWDYTKLLIMHPSNVRWNGMVFFVMRIFFPPLFRVRLTTPHIYIYIYAT